MGDCIETSGQGSLPCSLIFRAVHIYHTIDGWDPRAGVIRKNFKDEIDGAFRNVELSLKAASGKGWGQTFCVTSYHVPLNEETLQVCVENFKKYITDHQPVWTAVSLAALGSADGHIEIEVTAIDGREPSPPGLSRLPGPLLGQFCLYSWSSRLKASSCEPPGRLGFNRYFVPSPPYQFFHIATVSFTRLGL